MAYLALQCSYFGGKPMKVTNLQSHHYHQDGVSNTRAHETFRGNDSFRMGCVESYYEATKRVLLLFATPKIGNSVLVTNTSVLHVL